MTSRSPAFGVAGRIAMGPTSSTDTEPLVWLETGASLREGEPLFARVNLGHPLIAKEAVVISPTAPQNMKAAQPGRRRCSSARSYPRAISLARLQDVREARASNGRPAPIVLAWGTIRW